MTVGTNWHQVVGGTAIALDALLTLTFEKGYNIVWLGAYASNNNTIYIGFNSNVTVPSNGTASATDGWPLAAGKTLPLLVGELFNAGLSIYAIAGAAAQDLAIICY